jgi:hypothetical protein
VTAISRLVDTDLFRKLATTKSGKAIRSSAVYHSADMKRRSVLSRRAAVRSAEDFESVRSAVLFIGHVKSGGSLTGAMLDAHQQAIVSDEIDVLKYVAAGFDRDQLLQLIRRGAAREASKGRITARRLEPYSLAIPQSFQGTSISPLVIGDTRAGPTTRSLSQHGALDRLVEVMSPIDVLFVHVVRDPREPIAAMVRRSGRDPVDAANDYFEQAERLTQLRVRLGDRVHTQYYEDLLSSTRPTLRRLGDFLGIPFDDDFLASCDRLIDHSRPSESSLTTEQLPDHSELAARCEPYDFLGRYGL